MFSRTAAARGTGYLSLPLREEGREGEAARKGYNVERPKKAVETDSHARMFID